MFPPLDRVIMIQALIHEAKYLMKSVNWIENSDLTVEVCSLGFSIVCFLLEVLWIQILDDIS